MKKKTLNWLAAAISAAPLLYLALRWTALPAVVPTRYHWDMTVSQTAPKAILWWVSPLLTVLSIGIYCLFANLHRLNPKQKGKTNGPVFTVMGLGVALFLSITNLLLVVSVNDGAFLYKALLLLVGLLVAFLGLCLAGTTPNAFAGFRLPWTLNDETVWRKTHRLAAKFWVAGGLLLALGGLVLPFAAAFAGFVVVILVISLIPALYSYHISISRFSN